MFLIKKMICVVAMCCSLWEGSSLQWGAVCWPQRSHEGLIIVWNGKGTPTAARKEDTNLHKEFHRTELHMDLRMELCTESFIWADRQGPNWAWKQTRNGRISLSKVAPWTNTNWRKVIVFYSIALGIPQGRSNSCVECCVLAFG